MMKKSYFKAVIINKNVLKIIYLLNFEVVILITNLQ
jgi:hypothetical protein